jgi:hypothetical protein
MNSNKIALKLYAKSSPLPETIRFVEVFHDWIKKGVLPELMIDVIEYGHVERGPIVLFVGHESDYSIDMSEGRAGLSYLRKRVKSDIPGDSLALTDSFARVLNVADKLATDPRLGGFQVGRDEVLLRLVDRLNAPNSDATFDASRSEIELVASAALGKSAKLTREADDLREPFAVRIRA